MENRCKNTKKYLKNNFFVVKIIVMYEKIDIVYTLYKNKSLTLQQNNSRRRGFLTIVFNL